jgi:hypothetical protein
MEVETPDDDTGAAILAFFICAGLLALLVWYLYYRDTTPEDDGDESIDPSAPYQAYNDMSPEELARTIADARGDFYSWNDSQFFPLAGGTIGSATTNLPMNVPRLMVVMTGAVLLDPGTLRAAMNILKRRILSLRGAMSEARIAYRVAKATVATGEKLLTRLGISAGVPCGNRSRVHPRHRVDGDCISRRNCGCGWTCGANSCHGRVCVFCDARHVGPVWRRWVHGPRSG